MPRVTLDIAIVSTHTRGCVTVETTNWHTLDLTPALVAVVNLMGLVFLIAKGFGL